MKIDITEEERQFILRVCIRAKLFIEMNIIPQSFSQSFESDLEKITSLTIKLEEPDER